MTRISLHKLATDAGQWLVRAPDSPDVSIDEESDTVRAGIHASDDTVAEVLVRCLLRVRGASLDHAAVHAELARYGYEQPELTEPCRPRPATSPRARFSAASK